jgi:hypothetical protein
MNTQTAGDSLCGTRAEPASFRSATLCQDVLMEHSAVRLHCLREHIAGKSLRDCHENRDNYVMRSFTVWTLCTVIQTRLMTQEAGVAKDKICE